MRNTYYKRTLNAVKPFVSPLAAYHDISFSDKNFCTSRNRSSLTFPGKMTDDHGRAGRDTGFCHVGLMRLMSGLACTRLRAHLAWKINSSLSSLAKKFWCAATRKSLRMFGLNATVRTCQWSTLRYPVRAKLAQLRRIQR